MFSIGLGDVALYNRFDCYCLFFYICILSLKCALCTHLNVVKIVLQGGIVDIIIYFLCVYFFSLYKLVI